MVLIPDGSFEYQVISGPPCYRNFESGPAGRWTTYAHNGVLDMALVKIAACNPAYFAQLPAPDGSNIMFLQTTLNNSFTQMSQTVTGLSIGEYQISWFHTIRGQYPVVVPSLPPKLFQVFACDRLVYNMTEIDFPSVIGVPFPFVQYKSFVFTINSTLSSDGCLIIFKLSTTDTNNRAILIDKIELESIQTSTTTSITTYSETTTTTFEVLDSTVVNSSSGTIDSNEARFVLNSNNTGSTLIVVSAIVGGIVFVVLVMFIYIYYQQKLPDQQKKTMNTVKPKQAVQHVASMPPNDITMSQMGKIADRNHGQVTSLKPNHIKNDAPPPAYTTKIVGSPITKTSYGNTTILVESDHVMSVPAYLKVLPGSYKLERSIARGGFGEIFFISYPPEGDIATRAKGRQLLAKRISSSTTNSSQFMQELSMMNLFNGHPNFVAIYGYDDLQQIIITEFYPAGSLNLFMVNIKSFKLHTLITILHGAANAIKEMHERGLVHNDLKTANILIKISKKGIPCAVLTDFGLANIVDNTVMKVGQFVISNTQGTTLCYCAPDRMLAQFPNVSANHAKMADVYSYGMIIYAVVSRKEPWE